MVDTRLKIELPLNCDGSCPACVQTARFLAGKLNAEVVKISMSMRMKVLINGCYSFEQVKPVPIGNI